MSILPMYKKCANCNKQFTYNPDTNDPGMICPYCRKPANIKITGEKIKNEDVSAIKEMLDDFRNSDKNK